MTLDALRLEVPDIIDDPSASQSELVELFSKARSEPLATALQQVVSLLFRLNRSPKTLLERQRALQNFSDEYRYYSLAQQSHEPPPALYIHLCSELAIGFKRLLLQILQGRNPSPPHLAWCLYMAQHFLAQTQLRHYQVYQEPPPSLWRDSHLLYWIGEHQKCLDEPVAAAFKPATAPTLRGVYQQMLIMALSNPFHLHEGECLLLFSALAPLSGLARLLPWEEDDDSEGPIVDLSESQPCLSFAQSVKGDPQYLRRFELGPLLVALHDPAPLQTIAEGKVLNHVQQHWMGRQQRRHERLEMPSTCDLVVGLNAVHSQLLGQRPTRTESQIMDASAGGARLLCDSDRSKALLVGQLVLIINSSETPTLALIRWRHLSIAGLHIGLRYLKGLPRPVWLRRAPVAQTHPGILQSTPAPGSGWHHGVWLPIGQFVEGESLWLQLANANSQKILPLPASNLSTPIVSRHPMGLG
ncbi:PilZ domain-containing protein [Pseudomonas sp. EL_65y_Pfl2_R95]|uniref:PilZ domain-containing protein n=1 Tax=Pseudomonas sp. EL_65y_Pfl2_R95 TaxID=3088698 RepID=UPI0030DB03DB